MRRTATFRAVALALALTAAACTGHTIWKALSAPEGSDVLRFAVIGDSGTGGRQQYDVARRMARYREQFPFELVIMLGDNLYGRETPADYARKFEQPYKALLDAGVKFYAALGNHDQLTQRLYAPFNMNGERYYSFVAKNVQFFALDSNYMDPAQLEWLDRELARSQADWKIAFFHHPLYSSGRRHGSEDDLRILLEPVLVRHGVDVVFAGHEHLYERIKPQQGIAYFTSGGAAKLSRGDLGRQPTRAKRLTAVGYDQDRHFMLIAVSGDTLEFQAITRTGATIDQGVIKRRTLQRLLPDLVKRDAETDAIARPRVSPSTRPSVRRPPASRDRSSPSPTRTSQRGASRSTSRAR